MQLITFCLPAGQYTGTSCFQDCQMLGRELPTPLLLIAVFSFTTQQWTPLIIVNPHTLVRIATRQDWGHQAAIGCRLKSREVGYVLCLFFSQGSAETLFSWGRKINCLLTAWSLGNVCQQFLKSDHACSSYSRKCRGFFFEKVHNFVLQKFIQHVES